MQPRTLMAALFTTALAFAAPAHAIPITYDFTATAGSGPLAGNSYAGVFTVDSAGVASGSAPLESLAFNFLGITYTTGDSAFGLVPAADFAADGSLISLAGYVVLSYARAAALFDPADGRAMNSPATSFSFDGAFNYGIDPFSAQNQYGAENSFAGAARAVPEPASLALVATALLGATLRRRKG